ncbi:MAG: hypothetical protein QGE95_15995, partial [Arenicellales bacterium]|nr:hypothetical protein [Arenicellales bacterium]
NLLLAEVRDCTISGPRNPVVICFTSPLSSLTAISPPNLFCFQSPTHNLLQLAAVFKRHYHAAAAGKEDQSTYFRYDASPTHVKDGIWQEWA